MQKNVLNFIIALAIFGIVVALSRDFFFKNTTDQTNSQQSEIPTLIPSPSSTMSQPTTCSNTYFNFKKGTTWRYKLQKGTQISYLTTTITTASASSILVENILDNQKPTVTSISCNTDGLYGFPIPLLSILNLQQSSLGQFSNFLKFDTDIRFLPNNSLLKLNSSWNSPIPIKLSLPINLPINIAIKNKITEEKKALILNVGVKNTLNVTSGIDLASLGSLSQFIPSSPPSNSTSSAQTTSNIQLFQYTLAEGIGITQMNITLNLDSTNQKGIAPTLTLIQFTPGK